MAYQFKCECCGKYHDGVPGFAYDNPIQVFYVPERERDSRVKKNSELCSVDNKVYCIRACVEIPVIAADDPFIWGMWPEVSKDDFMRYARGLREGILEERSFPGILNGLPPFYPDELLNVFVHVRPIGTRPSVQIEHSEHPFSLHQRNGYSLNDVQEITETLMHGNRSNRKPW